MKQIVALAVLALTSVMAPTRNSTRRTVARDDCPKVFVTCPDEVPREGGTLLVKVNVEGVDPATKLSYKWSVVGAGGEIVSGQGTPIVKVRCTHPERTTTTTVEIGGLPSRCVNTASCSFPIS